MVGGSWLMAPGTWLRPQGSWLTAKKNVALGPGAEGTQHQMFLGLEPWGMSFEPWAIEPLRNLRKSETDVNFFVEICAGFK